MGKEWKQQEGAGIWLPKEEDEELLGEVVKIDKEAMYGTQYIIKKKDGEEVLTPSHKVLQNRMQKAEVGTMVKIVFVGEEPPKTRGENPTKMYEVFFEE